MRLLDAEGRIGEADAHLRIPPGVRAVIGRRVARLSERCRNLLAAPRFWAGSSGWTLSRGSASFLHDDMLDALDDAMAERIVTDVPESPGGFASATH